MPLESPRQVVRRANLILLLSDPQIGGPTGLVAVYKGRLEPDD